MVGGLVVVAMLLLVGSTYDVQASYVEPEFLPGASNKGKSCSDL
jgi:hypothetical protein